MGGAACDAEDSSQIRAFPWKGAEFGHTKRTIRIIEDIGGGWNWPQEGSPSLQGGKKKMWNNGQGKGMGLKHKRKIKAGGAGDSQGSFRLER